MRKLNVPALLDPTHLSLLLLAIAAIAFLYSSVGHAGASGYIAVMTLFGLAPTVIRPTALLLNIFVAVIGSLQFAIAGHFRWRLFWPFAVLSVPAAYLGGNLQLPVTALRILIGIVLFFSALRLFFRRQDPASTRAPAPAAAITLGAAIGLLSGLTGTGGGIFLTPILLFFKWARIREAAAVSVLFILLNSIAGLAGYFSASGLVPSLGLILAAAAIVGGALGSYFGSRRFPAHRISLALAIVLIIAGVKLIFTR